MTRDDLHEALDRIARTPDGRIFYRFLQEKLMEAIDPGSDGALRRDLGERIFAAKLTSLMGKGIQESAGGSSIDDTTGGAEPLIVIARPKPVDVGPGRPRGNRPRVDERTFVPGYDYPDET